MRILGKLAGLALGVAALAGPAAAQEDTITLRVADSFPVGHFIPEYLTKPWMERVTEATDGTVQFEYYPAQQLGKAKDMLSLTQSGVTDIAYVAPAHVTDKMPLSGVVELPGQFSTSCQGMQAYLELINEGQLTEREFEPNSVKPLLTLVNPPYQILTKQPIEGLESFQGLKLRSGGGAMDVMAGKIGAVPVRMAGPDVYESLSRGTLDGIVFPLANVMEYDLQEHVKYSTTGENFGSFVHNYVISDRKWNELPEDVRQVMVDVGMEVTKEACGKIDADVQPAIETLKSAGVTMVELPAEDKERLATLLGDVGKEWAAGLGSRKDSALETLQAFSDALAQ